jgi:hypothetical protein
MWLDLKEIALKSSIDPGGHQALKYSRLFPICRNALIFRTAHRLLDFGCSVDLAFSRVVPSSCFRFDVSVVLVPFINDISRFCQWLVFKMVLNSQWRSFSNTGTTSWPSIIAHCGLDPVKYICQQPLANSPPSVYLHVLRRYRTDHHSFAKILGSFGAGSKYCSKHLCLPQIWHA